MKTLRVLAVVLALSAGSASAAASQCVEKAPVLRATILSTAWVGAMWAMVTINPVVGFTLAGMGAFGAQNVADDCKKS